jgi:hypothetical protein
MLFVAGPREEFLQHGHLVEPGQLGVGRGHEVVQGVEVGHPLVGENKELVVRLLEDGHPLAVDLELLAVESNLGFPAFLDVALELEWKGDGFKPTNFQSGVD